MNEQGRGHPPLLIKPRWRASPRQVIGEILMTMGVLALLFAFHEAYWTNIGSGLKQSEAQESLARSWGERADGQRVNPRQSLSPELGEAFARMYIPAFGSDFQFAIVEGTGDEDLLAGPGHYVDSQLPGQPGNFALAGHRVGKGAPFNDLGNLKVCDVVVVETQTSWETYRVLPIGTSGTQRLARAQSCFTPGQATEISEGIYSWVEGRHITVPGDIGVLSPVPNQPVAPGDELEGLLTLTTCHPRFSNEERMIVHAMLVESAPKDPVGNARPKALEEN